MIPGHGGIMDRFDCQFLMATFVNVYISSFIRTASPAKLLQQVMKFILKSVQIISFIHHLESNQSHLMNFKFSLPQVFNLKPEQQLQLYNSLRDHLENLNILDLN